MILEKSNYEYPLNNKEDCWSTTFNVFILKVEIGYLFIAIIHQV